MAGAFSWQNSISLCPPSFCTPRPNSPVIPRISWLTTFAFQSPIMKRISFWGISSRRSCRFIQPFNFSFFSMTFQGIDLDYSDIEWFALEMNIDHSVIFEITSKYCILDSFVDYAGYSISSKGFLPTVVREGNGTPLQYSCLENPMDRGAWWAAIHRVAKSWTGLSDFTFTFHFHALEKEMATHSSVLAWRIPGTAEPGGLLSMGSHRVGHDWSDLVAAAHSSRHNGHLS